MGQWVQQELTWFQRAHIPVATEQNAQYILDIEYMKRLHKVHGNAYYERAMYEFYFCTKINILICYDISEQDLQSYQFRNSPYQSNINSAKIEGKHNLFWCLRERIVKLLMLLENIMRAMTKGNH